MRLGEKWLELLEAETILREGRIIDAYEIIVILRKAARKDIDEATIADDAHRIVILDPDSSDPAWGGYEDARIVEISDEDMENLIHDHITISELLRREE